MTRQDEVRSSEFGVRNFSFRIPHSAFRTALASCCLLLLSGCVHRSLTIRTEPPGAKVYVNDELKGDSPLTYDFTWYGWYRLTLRKDGFERLDDRKLLRAPVHLWIPFDLFMELLPLRVRDARTWSYTLTPTKELPTPVPPAPSAATVGTGPAVTPPEETTDDAR